MIKEGCDIGLIGLGVMGRNFLMNVADHAFAVAGFDVDSGKADALEKEKGAERDIRPVTAIREFVSLLRRPRTVMLLVPAGNPVDAVIDEITPLLDPGDLIIDSGNSHFRDTDRRGKALIEKKILFMGMGISGGEYGARHGPSLMPGGPVNAYERVKPILEAAAARVDKEPCVTHLGAGSAGHYVKMIHNGIEYGIVQLISETYGMMKQGLGLDADMLGAVYDEWNRTKLDGYLIEITSKIFSHYDEKTGKPLIDMILDEARQKGTGMWTSWEAMELQVPTPTIDAAVMMRNLSVLKAQREATAEILHGPDQPFAGNRDAFLSALKNALYIGMIVTYAQGFALLKEASRHYDYGLNLEAVARIWRGGCIIRTGLLEDIRSAYGEGKDLPNLLLDSCLSREVMALQEDLRHVVRTSVHLGIPAPAFMASLGYVDAMRSKWLPANLIQAQRDYFGAHTYERIDIRGTFHTQWQQR
ncbi:MAG: NADP-dependent phosphogluconate dehydrogenase [Deltaproteobacteria bacterium]|nr:NADP-dependent phosphogluconate dehydrogenase [Deltaproteobacteria bacterium]